MKTIALCGMDCEVARALERHGGYNAIHFCDEPDRRGCIKLAYYLQSAAAVDLAVIGYPGAAGLSACDYLRGQYQTLPLLWLCERPEFEPEARRLCVDFCSAKPPGTAYLPDAIAQIERYLESHPHIRNSNEEEYR